MLKWTPSLFEAQGGDFSSAKRYVRAVASGGYALSTGRTLKSKFVNTGGYLAATWHYTIPGVYDKVFTNGIPNSESPDPGAPTPVVQAVTM